MISSEVAKEKCDNISFEIISDNESSAQLILQWRNDPQTLSHSFHQDHKSWPEFYREFKNDYLRASNIPCLFALLNGKRIAVLRFRPFTFGATPAPMFKNSLDVSINLDPDMRGKGLGPKILKMLPEFLRRFGVERLIAEIKLDNLGSQKAFEAAGFKFFDESEHVVKDTNQNVKVKRYVLNLILPVVAGESEQLCSIGDAFPCFVIAEAGSNWRMGNATRDLQMGKALIDVAKSAGCDAVKFQTYRPETTYVKNAGESDYLASNGIKEDIALIFKDLSMPYELIEKLADYSKNQGIIFMSSPFSLRDLKEVDPFTPIHKIASYEITHVRLIDAIAATGKPTIFSTGASSVSDIEFAIERYKKNTTAPACLMQCTAKYPAPLSTLNLKVIAFLKSYFGISVGLSDHSRDPLIGPSAAVAAGANLLEKHFTLSNDLPGPDHKFALTPKELKKMVLAVRQVEEAMGDGVKTVLDEEKELYYFARRALQATQDIEVGEKFIEGTNFEILRPGKQKQGMHPKRIDDLSRTSSKRRIIAGDGIQESDMA